MHSMYAFRLPIDHAHVLMLVVEYLALRRMSVFLSVITVRENLYINSNKTNNGKTSFLVYITEKP